MNGHGLICALTMLVAGKAMFAQQGTWRGEQTRRGDTLIVKTVSGSVWRDTITLVAEKAIGSADGADALLFGRIIALDVDGAGNMYALDRQAFEVRVFSPAGEHLRTFGRKGGGPGEFDNPLGMRVTADGRVAVLDQARFSVFSPTGAYSQGWTLLGNCYSVGPRLLMTSDQRFLIRTCAAGRMVWHRIDGTSLDTVRIPERMPPAPMLQAGRGASYGIQYMPGTAWTVSAAGKVISARTDRYEIDVPGTGNTTMRIVRSVPPVPVPPGEAARIRDETTQRIRRNNNPAFEWNGPSVPETKPFIGSIVAGADGTLWVFRSTASVERKVDADAQKSTGYATAWRSTTVADVFDSQGRYLGAVKFPDALTTYPEPVLSSTTVWGIATHADGYPQIVRYRVQR